MGYPVRLQTLAAGVFALGLAAATSAQAPAKPPVKADGADGADGLLHTELSLIGRTASISFATEPARERPRDGIFRVGRAGSGSVSCRRMV